MLRNYNNIKLTKFINNKFYFFLLSVIFLITISPSLISLFLPISLEGHETSYWLHVLTLDSGINIYDHQKVAYINQAHGPTTSYIYYLIYKLMPFSKSYQLIRLPVFIFPFIIFYIFFKYSKIFTLSLFLTIFIYGIFFLLFQNVGGRSDYIASIFTCFSIFILFKNKKNNFDLIVLSLFISIIYTSNWRYLPIAFIIYIHFIFQEIYISKKVLTKKNLYFSVNNILVFLIYFGLMLNFSFDFDFVKFYNHFFGIISKQDNNALDRALSFYSPIYSQWFSMIIKSEKLLIIFSILILLLINDFINYKKKKYFFSL